MAIKLEKANIRIVLMNLLNDMEFYALEGKKAEHQASYIAGVLDMANAVMDAIEDLGGK